MKNTIAKNIFKEKIQDRLFKKKLKHTSFNKDFCFQGGIERDP